jgi:hypothetical protein
LTVSIASADRQPGARHSPAVVAGDGTSVSKNGIKNAIAHCVLRQGFKAAATRTSLNLMFLEHRAEAQSCIHFVIDDQQFGHRFATPFRDTRQCGSQAHRSRAIRSAISKRKAHSYNSDHACCTAANGPAGTSVTSSPVSISTSCSTRAIVTFVSSGRLVRAARRIA